MPKTLEPPLVFRVAVDDVAVQNFDGSALELNASLRVDAIAYRQDYFEAIGRNRAV